VATLRAQSDFAAPEQKFGDFLKTFNAQSAANMNLNRNRTIAFFKLRLV
jgi:hypothetical protein